MPAMPRDSPDRAHELEGLMRNRLIVFSAALLGVMAMPTAGVAQQAMIVNVPAPAEAPGTIPLYPGDQVGSLRDEIWTKLGPMAVVRNVTRPTLTPMLPSPDKATGA